MSDKKTEFPKCLSVLMDKDTKEILEVEITDFIHLGMSRRLHRLCHSERNTEISFRRKDSEAEPYKEISVEQWT